MGDARAGGRPRGPASTAAPPPRRPRADRAAGAAAQPALAADGNPRSNGRRPAGIAARPQFPRRILAVLALAFIGGALWLINATFQPFHDDPNGAVAVTVPAGADAGQIGELLKAPA